MLIAIAVYDTDSNRRTDMTRRTLESLSTCVDRRKHRIVVSDNGSCALTQDLLLQYDWMVTTIHNGSNIGTARAINKAWMLAEDDEIVCKMDNDVVVHDNSWPDILENAIRSYGRIGLCGLKRRDLWEYPGHENPSYRSELMMLPRSTGDKWVIVEKVNHVMGTCVAVNPTLRRKIGFLWQPRVYGFDDSELSARSMLAGYINVFIPWINIDHIDPGGTAYTDWKRLEAGRDMAAYQSRIARLRSGDDGLWCGADGLATNIQPMIQPAPTLA